MELIDVVKPECCSASFPARTKGEAIIELAKLLLKSRCLEQFDMKQLYDSLRKKEEGSSTGVGKGIALPHARIQGLKDFVVAVAISRRGVPFDAIDKKRCQIFFCLVGPAEAMNEHLKLLASISRLLSQADTRKELLKAKSDVALYEILGRQIADMKNSLTTMRAMKLMFVILYYEDLLYDILEFFLGQGIDGATILEGAGMGHYISNVPLFAEFIGFMQEKKNHSKTIMVLIPADLEKQLVQGIEQIAGDLDKVQGAMVVCLDISYFKGTMKMM